MELPKCQVCGAGIADDAAQTLCSRCETVHHTDCWEYNGGCATYACLESPASKRAPPPPAAQPDLVIIENRSGHRASPRPTSLIETLLTMVGQMLAFFILVSFCLAMLAAFVGGYTSVPKHKPWRARTQSQSREELLRGGDHQQKLEALGEIGKNRTATYNELRVVNSMIGWSTDESERLAAVHALGAISGRDQVVQAMLSENLNNQMVSVRIAVQEHLSALTVLSPETIKNLIGVVEERGVNADAAAGLLAEHPESYPDIREKFLQLRTPSIPSDLLRYRFLRLAVLQGDDERKLIATLVDNGAWLKPPTIAMLAHTPVPLPLVAQVAVRLFDRSSSNAQVIAWMDALPRLVGGSHGPDQGIVALVRTELKKQAGSKNPDVKETAVRALEKLAPMPTSPSKRER